MFEKIKNSKLYQSLTKATSKERPKSQNGTLYRIMLLSIIDDTEKMQHYFETGFGDYLQSIEHKNNTLVLTVKDDVKVSASYVNYNMNKENVKFLDEQLNAIWNHFRCTETKALDIKINLLHQIKLAKSIYEISFTVNDNEVVNKITSGILDTTYNSCGIILAGNGTVFLNSNYKTILNDTGNSELEYFNVMEPIRNIASENCTEEQLERRKGSMKILSDHHIYCPYWFHVIESKAEANFHDVREIAERTVALTLVAMYSEGILGQKWSLEKSREYIEPYLKRFNVTFSPEEQKYLDDKSPCEKTIINYCWQYEHAFVMLWALGFADNLPYPNSVCDVPFLANTVKGFSSIDEMLEKAKPRSGDELLNEADLILRYNWACIDVASQMGLQSPVGLDPSVVYDRHKALNWLIGSNNSAWDDVEVNA